MALNPVERRLALLCGHWIDFRSDSSKRLLLWQVPENALRLVQCFFEAQKHDLEYSSGDQFVVLDSPFEHSIQYSRALREALLGQYGASREDLEREGLSTDWDPPDVPDTAAGVIQTLRSLGSKYHKTIGHLAAVLTPADVSDETFFVEWLLRALATNLPERLRLVVADSIEHPQFARLAEGADPRIAVQTPAIDGFSTAQETFAQEAAVGPAAVFRNYLMGVVALSEKGTADQVKAKATDAFNFARAQGWHDQEVVLRILVAGAFLKEARHTEAIRVYQVARSAADQTVTSGHPAGNKLVLQTWFGEAGAHLAAADPIAAAGCYDQAAIIAREDANPILAIEAFRMGAFCHARARQTEEALQRGAQALALGAELKPDARAMTSLPIAAVDLLRVLDPDRVRLLEECKWRLERRLSAARSELEARVKELERTPDPGATREIESSLAQQTMSARAEAEQDLHAIVKPGNPAFREQFARAQALLGPDWPLHGPIALPASEPANDGGGSST